MKYIMLENEDGKKYPIIFSESLVHSVVSYGIESAAARRQKTFLMPTSAGFISFENVKTFGESESMDIKSKEIDAAYIRLGESASNMDEIFVKAMLRKLEAK